MARAPRRPGTEWKEGVGNRRLGTEGKGVGTGRLGEGSDVRLEGVAAELHIYRSKRIDCHMITTRIAKTMSIRCFDKVLKWDPCGSGDLTCSSLKVMYGSGKETSLG